MDIHDLCNITDIGPKIIKVDIVHEILTMRTLNFESRNPKQNISMESWVLLQGRH